jgi:hypothetical protein
MRLSEVLCFVLPFIIVILIVSIDKKEEGFLGKKKEIDLVEEEEIPQPPEQEEKTYDTIASLICAFTPIAGDYGCAQRDAMMSEKEMKKYETKVEKIKLKNKEKTEEQKKEIEMEKKKLCDSLGCKNGSKCEVTVDDANSEEEGIITIAASCACNPGYHGPDCSTKLEECTAEKDCNGGKGTLLTDYNIPGEGCKCKCDDGFGGNDCKTVYPQCTAQEHCSSRGKTDGYDTGEGCICECPEGWEGDKCDIAKVPCTKEDCSNNGKPEKGSYRPNPETKRTEGCKCECESSFSGNNCSVIKPVDWNKSPCLDDETCVPLRKNKSSRCIDNYYKTVNGKQIPECNECPNGSKNVNPPKNKGGRPLNPRAGSSSITDCVCDKDNEYLDKVTQSCEFCPDNKVKGPNTNGDSSDCICDISKGWNETIPKNTDKPCTRCGWDEDNARIKPGFVYKIVEENGVKTGKCVCGEGYVRVEKDGEVKCFPTGKCSTVSFLKRPGTLRDDLTDYEKQLYEITQKSELKEPHNVCNGPGARSILAKKIGESNKKDIRLKYNEKGEVEKGDEDVPILSDIGIKFMDKIVCKNGNCRCPGKQSMYLRGKDALPCEDCRPVSAGPKYLEYNSEKDDFKCSTSECFDKNTDINMKGLGCLNFVKDKGTVTQKKQDNPLKRESGPLIFKENDKWFYYDSTSKKTDISDKIPLLCNSSSSPPKCGSSIDSENKEDMCAANLGENWEETQDKDGNTKCYCKIPYEQRLEIDDGGKKRKACIYDTSSCDLYSTDPSCKITDVYKCPAWANQNEKWDEKGFRLWNMASINHIGEPDPKTKDVQLRNDGKIKEKECKGCYIPPPITPEGEEDGSDELEEVKNSSLFAGLPKKLSLSYMNDGGQWIHYCKAKNGMPGYSGPKSSFNALNPFTIMNDSQKPLSEGKTAANTDMTKAEGVCGKAQYYDIDKKKCFNIGGGCYSRGSDESTWYTNDIGDFYNMGLPACNFKSEKSISDTPTHDNRTKAGIAKKEKITSKYETDESNKCCQSCHYKFYSPNSSKLTNGSPKSNIFKKEKYDDLNSYLLPAQYYGPDSKTPVTNHAGCVGDWGGPRDRSKPSWRGGRPFCSPGWASHKIRGKGGKVQVKGQKGGDEDDHPVPIKDYQNTGPWEPDFQWTVHGATNSECGNNASTTYGKNNQGSCGMRNRTYGGQLPRRASISNWLKNAEGGGFAGMTGHADVAPIHRGLKGHRGSLGSRGLPYGAHGYSGDSGFGVSTEDIYQTNHDPHHGGFLHNNIHARGIMNAYINLDPQKITPNMRGKGRGNPVGWNNQVKYDIIKDKAESPSGDILDEVSGKRDHWLSENGSTMPITSSRPGAATTVGNNHDQCKGYGIGGGTIECNKSNRYPFDHHHPNAKNAKGIGYPGIKVPSAESTKRIYGSSLPFASTSINHAVGFNSLPTEYYLHNHPKEGDGPYDENGNKQVKKPANYVFADYGDNEFDVENKTHEQGKRYENLFYCKRSLGTANENPGNPSQGKDYKKMIGGATIDKAGFMKAEQAKGHAGRNYHQWSQIGAQGQWGGKARVTPELPEEGTAPLNVPHAYTKSLIGLGKWSWALQPLDKLSGNKKKVPGNVRTIMLGGSGYTHGHAAHSSKGTWKKDTFHIPKEQIKLLSGGGSMQASSAIVPRELNNMSYYDTEYGGWIPKNTSYQGTYLAQKWTRPYPGHNDVHARQVYDDRGGGDSATRTLSQSGCRNYAGAGGRHGISPLYVGGLGSHNFFGRPGWKPHYPGGGAGGEFSQPANPVVQGAGGETAWHKRSFKMNGKYGSCGRSGKWHLTVDKNNTKIV